MGRKRKEATDDNNVFKTMEPTEDSVVSVEDNTIVAPTMDSTQWHDYVMGLFDADEMQDGNPTVDGLRRVSQQIFGYIIDEGPKPVVSSNDFSVVEYFFIFENADGRQKRVSSLGETNNRNNCVTPFCHFPTTIAETRAQGRALRRALGLRKVISAEELGVIMEETPKEFGGLITQTQIKAINNLCKKGDIDVLKFINLDDQKYTSIMDVKHEDATKMIEHLNRYLADSTNPERAEIPATIKGYNKDWSIL